MYDLACCQPRDSPCSKSSSAVLEIEIELHAIWAQQDFLNLNADILGLDVGSSAHADYIHTTNNFAHAVSRMGSCVDFFCSANSLKLNSSKTEAVTFSKGAPRQITSKVAAHSTLSQHQVKCLCVWWQHDLSPCKSIDEKTYKAHCTFFATGSIGSFHGRLNPLSGHSVFDIFVIPVLLYGCETWILTPPLITNLGKFQSEIGRRILYLSKHHADLAQSTTAFYESTHLGKKTYSSPSCWHVMTIPTVPMFSVLSLPMITLKLFFRNASLIPPLHLP